jgi:hypothetical protein
MSPFEFVDTSIDIRHVSNKYPFVVPYICVNLQASDQPEGCEGLVGTPVRHAEMVELVTRDLKG